MSQQSVNSSQNFSDEKLLNMSYDKIKQIILKEKKCLRKIIRNIRKIRN